MTKEQMDRTIQTRTQLYKEYTPAEKTALSFKYTPEQMASIEAGEAAITAEDLVVQGQVRRDPFMPRYMDDFSRIERTIDKKIEKMRGEGQDYEFDDSYNQLPNAGELALGMDASQVFSQPYRSAETDTSKWGDWVSVDDPSGKKKWEFKWNPDQLDKLAEEEFFKTPEGKEVMTPLVEQRLADEAFASTARGFGATPDDIEILTQTTDVEAERDFNPDIEAPAEEDEVLMEDDQEVVDDDAVEMEEDDLEDDIDEDFESELEPATKMAKDEYMKALEEADPALFALKSQKPDYDYRSHPVYKACRDRVSVTMRPYESEWAWGTDEHRRLTEKYMEGNLPDVAPDIPKFIDPTVVWGPNAETEVEAEDSKRDVTGGLEDEALEAYQRVGKKMGQTVVDLLKYRVKTLVTHRVVNQTRLGKIASVYNLCVAGNEKGMVGIGEGKAAEGDEAVRVARLNAIRNMVPVLRYENRTIYGDIKGKVGASVVELGARRPGFGVRTNAIIFEIARCAGIYDLSARTPRSRNPVSFSSLL